MTTLMDIISACENLLGWHPPYRTGTHPRRTLTLEAHKLQKAIDSSENPRTATLDNLALALEYSRQKRLPIKSPAGLLRRIPDALELAYTPPTTSTLGGRVAAAIQWEQDHDDEQSPYWVRRLGRASGPGQTDVLADWKAGRRG